MTPLRTFLLPAPVELPCTARETGRLCGRRAALADVTRRFGREVAGTAETLNRECGPVLPGSTQHCDRVVDGLGTIPVTLKRGDRLRVTCTHDAGLLIGTAA